MEQDNLETWVKIGCQEAEFQKKKQFEKQSKLLYWRIFVLPNFPAHPVFKAGPPCQSSEGSYIDKQQINDTPLGLIGMETADTSGPSMGQPHQNAGGPLVPISPYLKTCFS